MWIYNSQKTFMFISLDLHKTHMKHVFIMTISRLKKGRLKEVVMSAQGHAINSHHCTQEL